MFSTISPLHIFIFGNHSLLFLSSDCSPLIKELIDFLILQINHNLACPAISFQFHFREIIFQYEQDDISYHLHYILLGSQTFWINNKTLEIFPKISPFGVLFPVSYCAILVPALPSPMPRAFPSSSCVMPPNLRTFLIFFLYSYSVSPFSMSYQAA